MDEAELLERFDALLGELRGQFDCLKQKADESRQRAAATHALKDEQQAVQDELQYVGTIIMFCHMNNIVPPGWKKIEGHNTESCSYAPA
jgi:hypothetical protein